jgi:hypothetical protein
MSSRQTQAATAALATVPAEAERVLVATGRYLGEGFDDARLDTLFLTMPISWRGILAQYDVPIPSLRCRRSSHEIPVTANETGDRLAELLLDHRPPRNEGEFA